MRLFLSTALFTGLVLLLSFAPFDAEARSHDPRQSLSTQLDIGTGQPAQWFGLPYAADHTTHTSVQIAKRGIKIGKVIDFFRGRRSGSLRGLEGGRTSTSGLSKALRGLGIRGIAVYGLLFLIPVLLFIALFRFLRSMLRGVFVSVRDAEIVDARLTSTGKYRPIVMFEDRKGQMYQALARFETRTDPRGDWAAVELSGNTFTVVPSRRSFLGVIGYILGPMVLSVAALMIAYYLDTAV